MMDFTDLERQVLEELKDSTHLKAVLEKFCELKGEECRRARVRSTWLTSRGSPRWRRTTPRERRHTRRLRRNCWNFVT